MKRRAEAMILTDWGNFNMIAYADSPKDKMPHLAMVHESTDTTSPVIVRVHSECLTGDLFHSHRCDCGEQLDKAMQIAAEKGGIIIYLRQEGRGIGLINKLKAYQLQDKGLDTIEANVHLGLEVDARNYDIAVEILKDLGVHSIHLLTNNPEKIEALDKSEINVLGRLPLIITPKEGNKSYLKTKKEHMGHLF